jgi:hypothetical protein
LVSALTLSGAVAVSMAMPYLPLTGVEGVECNSFSGPRATGESGLNTLELLIITR